MLSLLNTFSEQSVRFPDRKKGTGGDSAGARRELNCRLSELRGHAFRSSHRAAACDQVASSIQVAVID